MLYLGSLVRSDFCTESFHTVAYDWDINDVINLEDIITMFDDVQHAAEEDEKSSKPQHSSSQMSQEDSMKMLKQNSM